MNKKWFPVILIVGLMALLIVVQLLTGKKEETPKKKTDREKTRPNDPASVNRNRGFDRRISYIEYTRHAKCRMECRRISQAEVEEIMQIGKINYSKSDVNDRPCPTYALEGITHDDQRVRIVFAQCDEKTKVVTCIDLNTDWECHCPGDDAKHQNKN